MLKRVRIFIASPRDVGDEGARLARIVESLNRTGGTADSLGVTLELLSCDTHVPPDVGRPEGHILGQLNPRDWDIFIGILWKRFGTKTGGVDPSTGEDYQSGTEEEFKEAMRLRESGGTRWPWIMLYRCTRPPASLLHIDAEQLGRVNEFFRQCESDGRHPALVHTYDKPEDFERVARDHLEQVIKHYARDFLSRPGETGDANGGHPLPAPNALRLEVSVPGGMFRHALDRFLPRLHAWLTSNIGRLERPPEWPVLHNYLSTLRSDIAADIKLKTYVEPLAKAPPLEESERLRARPSEFLTSDQQRIKEIVEVLRGGDAQSAQISAINRKSRFVNNLVERLLKSDEPLILLGDPGTGKSITLQQAAMLIAERESRRIFPIVSLFVRLGEFRPDGRVTAESVWEYVKQAATPEIRPYLDSLDARGRLVIFFDGMDEMSRERYDSYTKALSVFAESRKERGTRTLFSCRIADFTPSFQHRRLLLLPFGRKQIKQYLARQILHFPIEIGGRLWSVRQLAKRLAGGGLPMQADNPFVLWLLCTYLREEHEWPKSRVHLLAYYNRYNYERKARDAARVGEGLPDMDAAFRVWGRVAYEITSRNKGAAIPLRNAESLLAAEDVPALDAAVQCGVIQKSMDVEVALIRFEHHRFQEYFTAFHLNQNADEKAALNWLEKLDAPRWQETLFNLVIMGAGREALAALSEAIAQEHMRLEEKRSARERDEEADTTRPVWARKRKDKTRPPDQRAEARARGIDPGDASAEMLLADRVELASRILQQTGPQLTDDTLSTLSERFRETAYWLADYGNPITKVKMLLASKAVQGMDIFRVARESLASDVAWVRQQALIVTSVVRRDVTEGAPHEGALEADLLHSFASGRFLKRAPGYFRIASDLKQKRVWVAFVVGLVLSLLQFLAGYGLVVTAYRGAVPAAEAVISSEFERLESVYAHKTQEAEEAGDEEHLARLRKNYEEKAVARARWLEVASGARGWLQSWWFFFLVSGAWFLTFLYTTRKLPGHQFLTSTSVGIILVLLPYAWWPLWLGYWALLVLSLMAVFFVASALYCVGWALLFLVHSLTLAPFAVSVSPHKGFIRRLRIMLEAMWDNCGFRAWWKGGMGPAYISGFMLASALMNILIKNRQSLKAFIATYGLFHYFPPAVDAVLTAATYAAVIILLLAFVSRRVEEEEGWGKVLNTFIKRAAIVCLAAPGVVLLFWRLTFVDADSVERLLLAASLFSFLPPAVNVALSASLYTEVLGALLALVLRLRGGTNGTTSSRMVFRRFSTLCLAVSAFALLMWGVVAVDWDALWTFLALIFGLLDFLPPPLNATFSVTLYAEGCILVAAVVSGIKHEGERWARGWALFRRWSAICLLLPATALLMWGIYLLSDYLAWSLALIFPFTIAVMIVILLSDSLKPLAFMIQELRGPIRGNRYNPALWQEQLQKLAPDYQAALLRRTTPETLGLFVTDFLTLLESVEGVIKDDPAQSAYWAKRQQIEQIIRQERIG